MKVAYLGGSITRADNGWHEQTFNWLKQEYQQTPFEQLWQQSVEQVRIFGHIALKIIY